MSYLFQPPKVTSYVLAESNAVSSITNTLTETLLASVKIPAGIMKANSSIVISAFCDYTASANTKSFRIKYANASGVTGTNYLSSAVGGGTNTSVGCLIKINNRNSLTSQIGNNSSDKLFWGITSTAALVTTALDTSLDTWVNITGQMGALAETFNLQGYTITLENI